MGEGRQVFIREPFCYLACFIFHMCAGIYMDIKKQVTSHLNLGLTIKNEFLNFLFQKNISEPYFNKKTSLVILFDKNN